MASGLPARLLDLGHDVRVVTPCHASAKPAFMASASRHQFVVPFLDRVHAVDVATVEGAGGVPVDLIGEDHYFGRDQVYGEPDDLLRYQFFCHAVTQLLTRSDWIPDIVHLNDWHTAPLAFALKNLAWASPALRGVASVFTIHNLRYRGPDEFNDFLCQAIYYSDMVTTVSPNYAREILTREFGEGLDDLLGLRPGKLTGILNGLDYDVFNPRTDPHLPRQFDLTCIADRVANRQALRAELALPATGGPLAAMVTRLTEQKGVDIVIQSVPEIVAAGAQLVILGDGDLALANQLQRLQQEYPANVRLAARFDDALAIRIYGGADMFLMPSLYEPCGLGQIIAMRYGAVPIGRRTGGLADTILDIDEQPEHATGFLFDEFNRTAFTSAFQRALRTFRDPALWLRLQRNGMSRDFSWRVAADHYVETYAAALHARGIDPHK